MRIKLDEKELASAISLYIKTQYPIFEPQSMTVIMETILSVQNNQPKADANFQGIEVEVTYKEGK